MTEEKTNAGKGLGIAALVLGILAVVCSFIPCISFWAIVLGIVGIILGAVGLSKAKSGGGAKGLPKSGLILSIIGTAIAIIWIIVFAGAMATAASGLHLDEFQDAMEEYDDAMNDYEDAMDEFENM